MRRNAQLDMQKELDQINVAELSRKEAQFFLEISVTKQQLELSITDLAARRDAWVSKAQAITPKLVEALQGFGDKEAVTRVAEALGPLTLMGGENVSGILNNILRGTSLEGVIGDKSNGQSLLTPPDGGNGEPRKGKSRRS